MKTSPLVVSRNDFVASLGVFMVAIPLTLGIALASGVPASAAIVTAIIGGVVVGLISGSPLVVSGPAAGLAALVLQYVQTYGLAGLAIITMLAGIIQILLGVARFGRFFEFVPKSILQGMLAAIGAIIAIGQVHVLAGQSVPPSVVAAVTSLPDLFRTAFGSTSVQIVLALGLVGIAIQLAWPKVAGKLKWLPGALPAVAIVALLALPFDIPRVQLASIVSEVLAATKATFGAMSMQMLGLVAVPAIALAVVASAETLLTARAVDTLAESKGVKSKSNLDREMVAQGVGNLCAGSLAGMPMTGVIVRSAANVNFGATSRMSTILHGLWILLAVIAVPWAVAKVPLTALASILIVTGFKLLNVKEVQNLWRHDVRAAVLWTVTFVAIVATDLLRGLGIAAVAAVIAYGKELLAATKSGRDARRDSATEARPESAS